jgi:hypothetical protein
VTIWHGLYAPKGTPAAVLAQINTALKASLKDPFIKKQEGLGAVLPPTTAWNLPPQEVCEVGNRRPGQGHQGRRHLRRLSQAWQLSRRLPKKPASAGFWPVHAQAFRLGSTLPGHFLALGALRGACRQKA